MKHLLALYLYACTVAAEDVVLLDARQHAAPPQPWRIAVRTGTPHVEQRTIDGTAGFCLESHSSSFAIQRRVTIDLSRTPILRLRWRVDHLPPDADFRTSKDDQAAQFFVAFKTPLRYRAINYIWDTTAPVGAVGNYDLLWFIKIKTVVVASGGQNAQQWVEITRNVASDYRALFGSDPPPVAGVRFQVNSQYTASQATGCLASVSLGQS